jgi:protein FAM32A
MAPTFLGGKLRLKGKDSKVIPKKALQTNKFDASAKVVSTNKDQSSTSNIASTSAIQDDGLTEAERKSLKIKLEREKAELEKIARKSHRERIEEFNEKLSSLTELNDIPRISAAGNG